MPLSTLVAVGAPLFFGRKRPISSEACADRLPVTRRPVFGFLSAPGGATAKVRFIWRSLRVSRQNCVSQLSSW